MITLDGKPLSTWGLKTYGSHKHPGTPETTSNRMPIPGMDGEWDFGSRTGVRTFTHPLRFTERDLIQRQRNLREFVAFLYDPYGNPREVKLIYEYEPDKYYLVKLDSKIDPERLYRHSTFDLSLVANKPRAKFVVPSSEISWDSDIPFMNDILWGMDQTEFKITSPQTITIIYSGTKAIRAGFKLQGAGTDVKVSANGKTMSFGNMANTTYEVDGESFTIKKNGVDSLVSTNFIELVHGENEVSISGYDLNLTFSEQLTYQFI